MNNYVVEYFCGTDDIFTAVFSRESSDNKAILLPRHVVSSLAEHGFLFNGILSLDDFQVSHFSEHHLIKCCLTAAANVWGLIYTADNYVIYVSGRDNERVLAYQPSFDNREIDDFHNGLRDKLVAIGFLKIVDNTRKCNCDIMVLMCGGCKCGGA